MLGWGALGYFFNKIGVQPAPMVLGFVLGPLLEENFRRAMLLSGGDPAVFLQRPISAALLAVAAVLLVVLIFPAIRQKREKALQE
jgi:TctA family transporter